MTSDLGGKHNKSFSQARSIFFLSLTFLQSPFWTNTMELRPRKRPQEDGEASTAPLRPAKAAKRSGNKDKGKEREDTTAAVAGDRDSKPFLSPTQSGLEDILVPQALLQGRKHLTTLLPDLDTEEEAWNERSAARTQLLTRLKSVFRDKLEQHDVPPAFWAFCQVADLSALNDMIRFAQTGKTVRDRNAAISQYILDCSTVIGRYKFNISY
jgi:hypothetical protein